MHICTAELRGGGPQQEDGKAAAKGQLLPMRAPVCLSQPTPLSAVHYSTRSLRAPPPRHVRTLTLFSR